MRKKAAGSQHRKKKAAVRNTNPKHRRGAGAVPDDNFIRCEFFPLGTIDQINRHSEITTRVILNIYKSMAQLVSRIEALEKGKDGLFPFGSIPAEDN